MSVILMRVNAILLRANSRTCWTTPLLVNRALLLQTLFLELSYLRGCAILNLIGC